ncbi:NAD(P)-binding domain-containing protein [Tessaracoccus coleopterorum]|uniref:NAD(P)-binding domain-containing protein n=1 Tax=Tessaracoccus coleopterorum TaxID=2714950 RepID=UPI002F919D4C
MRIGLIGLGKMGANMRERLRRRGVEVVGLDHNQAISDATDEADLVAKLGDGPRVVWLMVPIQAVTPLVETLRPLLGAGDIVIDGGNSKWTHDARHASYLGEAGIHFLDVGTSGGVWASRTVTPSCAVARRRPSRSPCRCSTP